MQAFSWHHNYPLKMFAQLLDKKEKYYKNLNGSKTKSTFSVKKKSIFNNFLGALLR